MVGGARQVRVPPNALCCLPKSLSDLMLSTIRYTIRSTVTVFHSLSIESTIVDNVILEADQNWRSDPVVKSQLMPFEFLLLFCVEVGIETPYTILTHTGVGIGASSPTLKRLELKGLVASTPGSRNKLFYRTTPKGKEALREGFKDGLNTYGRPISTGPYDTLHRIIFFAWVKGRRDEAHEAVSNIRDAIERKRRDAEEDILKYKKVLASRHLGQRTTFNGYDDPYYMFTVFRYLEAYTDSQKAELEIEATARLDELIEGLPPSPQAFALNSEEERISLTDQLRDQER
jgi:DNA-binding PadR family transcriptional regulator